MPFPDFWPKFTPKDKLGDWFETYASSLELNCWLSTRPSALTYDDGQKQWTVELDRAKDGKQESRELLFISFRLSLTSQVLYIHVLSSKPLDTPARRTFLPP
jgi:hypothetical protein